MFEVSTMVEPEELLHILEREALREGEGGGRMTEVMEARVGEAGPLEGRLECARHGRRVERSADAEAGIQMGVRPSTAKRHLADLRARSGLTTEQLIYRGRDEGRLAVLSLEPDGAGKSGFRDRCLPGS